MQLDLLLSSLERNAPGVFQPMHVLWRATSAEFQKGYRTCGAEHPEAWFVPEDDLAVQVRYLLREPEHATFFTDDGVLYRPLTTMPLVVPIPDLLCFSLRLGRNTRWCYPHAREQRFPVFEERAGALLWDWTRAHGDFGYVGSLDGHIFRGETLRRLLADLPTVRSPNQIEERLVRGLTGDLRLMGSYCESHFVGLPANRVQTTNPNRNGETHPYDVAELNRRYLADQRIDLDALDFSDIQGAHQELELRFR